MKARGKPPFAFSDSNPKLWGKCIENTLCIPLAQAPLSAKVVVSIYNGGEARRQLRACGFNVTSFAEFYRKELHSPDTDITLPYSCFDCRELLYKSSLDIDKATRVWADDESIREFNAQILYRQTLDDGVLPKPSPVSEQYFPPEHSMWHAECFVDCGAFTGDSCAAYIKKRGAAIKNDKIIAIEPDPKNADKLCDFIQKTPGPDWTVFNCALTNRPGDIMFNCSGNESASISPKGTRRVKAETLNRLLADYVPTRIKMDIEGAEPLALAGAKETLRRCKPDLAICLYHCPEHLWTIPLWLKATVPEYKLHLRRYAEECWELVCYATIG